MMIHLESYVLHQELVILLKVGTHKAVVEHKLKQQIRLKRILLFMHNGQKAHISLPSMVMVVVNVIVKL